MAKQFRKDGTEERDYRSGIIIGILFLVALALPIFLHLIYLVMR